MESIYAALLLHKASKEITEANLEKVLKAAGAEVDNSQLTKIVAGLKNKNIDDIIKTATAMPVMAAPAATGAATSAAPAKDEKKKKEEKEKEEEPTGIGSLF
jgi:large subunit ribosomal protein L12